MGETLSPQLEGQSEQEVTDEADARQAARPHRRGTPSRLRGHDRRVDETKREKDAFFGTIARLARDQAREEGIEVEVLAGHAAELIVRQANQGKFDLVVVGHKGPFPRGLSARLDRRPGRASRRLSRDDRQVGG